MVDADAVAREVVLPGTPGLAEVIAAFGTEILDASGALDRKALGAKIFADPSAREQLNAILHPRIALESARRIAAASGPDVPYVLYDAALLIETGRAKAFPAVVLITAPRDTQIARLIARDGLTREEAIARIDAQMPSEEKRRYATHIFDNDGDLAALREKVRATHASLLQALAP